MTINQLLFYNSQKPWIRLNIFYMTSLQNVDKKMAETIQAFIQQRTKKALSNNIQCDTQKTSS